MILQRQSYMRKHTITSSLRRAAIALTASMLLLPIVFPASEASAAPASPVMMTALSASASRTKKKASSKKKTSSKKRKTSSSKKRKKNTTSRRSSGSRRSHSAASQSSRTGSADYTLPATPVTPPKQAKDPNLRKIQVNKPDLEAIRKATLDPHHKYYFPKLMARYQRNDTTMTAEEYRYFYLGYMFQEDYDPYRTSPYSGRTDSLRMKATHTKEEIDTIRKYAELTLRDNPFDLRQMSFLVHVLKEKRKDMTAKIWEYRLEQLLGAVKSTGTGEDIENAWYVIYPMHEYDVIQLLGYEATDADFIEPGYDYLTVRPDGTQRHSKPAQGFYFNVQVPQQQYELKHPEEEENEPSEISEPSENSESSENSEDSENSDDIPAL